LSQEIKKYIVLRNKPRKNFLEEIGKKEKVFENLGVSDNCSAKKT
jgi:hypothetical protein